MKRSGIDLHDVADWNNLVAATWRAAQGKRDRPEVQRFLVNVDEQLSALRTDILNETLQVGAVRQFRIRDPKPRLIHAPAFRERVLHHALIAQIGPVLDRTLVFDTYACRPGKGTLAAVQRCHEHLRRYPWSGKLDVRTYFASIDHGLLINLLARRLKDPGVLRLCTQLIASHATGPGRGLPIGALTSQHFANYYLGGFDRFLVESCRVQGMVRYMDDVLWWGEDKASVRKVFSVGRDYLGECLALSIHEPGVVQRSVQGATFCGFRLLPGQWRLSLRRRRRYTYLRKKWETRYANGEIDALALQRAYAAVVGATLHADAAGWRQRQLALHPLNDACSAL
jgi:RNA-directed DNA polymerase